MPHWPASLPRKPLLEGFAFTPPRLTVSSPNDTGPPSVRRRTTAGHAMVTASWALDGEQFAAFQAFYEVETAGGAVPFAIAHPLTGEDAEALFDPEQQPTFTKLAAAIWRVETRLLLLP